MTTPDKPKGNEEDRMRAFIHWKFKEKDLCEDDRVMWQEFLNVLEAKDCIIAELNDAIQKAVEDEREACAKEADKHGQEYSALADEFEKDPVEKFMSEATKSHIVSDMASVAQECICIATAIRSRGGK